MLNFADLWLLIFSIHFVIFLLLGDSPLHFAVQSNEGESLTTLLILYEANPNVFNTNGSTPLDLAVDEGKIH